MPHFGSLRNVSPEFFRRVTADHYIIVPHQMFRLPAKEVLSMIVEARGAADYRIHLPPTKNLPWLKAGSWGQPLRAKVLRHEDDGFTVHLT